MPSYKDDVRYNSDLKLFTYKDSPDLPENVADWIETHISRSYTVGEQIQYRYQLPGTAGIIVSNKAVEEQIFDERTPVPEGPQKGPIEPVKEPGWRIEFGDVIRTPVGLPLSFALERKSHFRKSHWSDVSRYWEGSDEVIEDENISTGWREKATGYAVSSNDRRVRATQVQAFYLHAQIVKRIDDDRSQIRDINTELRGGVIMKGNLNRSTWNRAWEELMGKLADMLDRYECDIDWKFVETRYNRYSPEYLAERTRVG